VAASCNQAGDWTLSIRQSIFNRVTANDASSVSRVAAGEKLSLLLDKAQQFETRFASRARSSLPLRLHLLSRKSLSSIAGSTSIALKSVRFPGEKSLRTMDALIEPFPENPSYPIPGSPSAPGNRRACCRHSNRRPIFWFRERRSSSGRARRQVDGGCLGPKHCALRHVADQFASRRSLRTLGAVKNTIRIFPDQTIIR
jgi:hypothetical protein